MANFKAYVRLTNGNWVKVQDQTQVGVDGAHDQRPQGESGGPARRRLVVKLHCAIRKWFREQPRRRGQQLTKLTIEWKTLYYTSLSPKQLQARDQALGRPRAPNGSTSDATLHVYRHSVATCTS